MELDEQTINKLSDRFEKKVDEALKDNVEDVVGEKIANNVERHVKKLRMQREFYGKDLTGLDKEQKEALTHDIKAVFNPSEKAAMLESDDSAGGYLVPSEVFAGIQRIAATAGHVMRDSRQFEIGSNELDVPTYTGSELLGSFVGEDSEGSESDVTFDDAKLHVKKWMVILRMSNDLINDSNVDLADWLLSLVGEGLSARMDKEGFQGGTYAGSPFVGIFGSSDVTTYNLGGSDTSGNTSFSDFDPVVDGTDIPAQVKTSVLPNAAWYFHRTVWAKIKQATDSNDSPVLNINGGALLQSQNREGLSPVGMLDGYPVYTSDYLPDNGSSDSDTKFGIFGSLREALYVGQKADSMRVMESQESDVGGRNLFKSDQRALRFTHRWATSIGLPSAAVAIETSSS